LEGLLYRLLRRFKLVASRQSLRIQSDEIRQSHFGAGPADRGDGLLHAGEAAFLLAEPESGPADLEFGLPAEQWKMEVIRDGEFLLRSLQGRHRLAGEQVQLAPSPMGERQGQGMLEALGESYRFGRAR